jgi:hypothetical protein
LGSGGGCVRPFLVLAHGLKVDLGPTQMRIDKVTGGKLAGRWAGEAEVFLTALRESGIGRPIGSLKF